MFTGLIKDLGQVIAISKNAEGAELSISSKKLIHQIKVDDSVATNGVCLTATKVDQDKQTFTVQAVHITLEKTSLGRLVKNDLVNLELALLPTDRLGGHFVQGHVNGTGTVTSIENRGKNFFIGVKLPDKLRRYCIPEGSIALEGISLTLAKVDSDVVYVSIIPHTWEHTNLKTKKVGSILNIEVDMLAKYIEKLVLGDDQQKKGLKNMLKEW